MYIVIFLHLYLSVCSKQLKQVIEAEAALLELKSTNNPAAALRFYSLIPHQPEYNIDLIQNHRALIEKMDLCQVCLFHLICFTGSFICSDASRYADSQRTDQLEC